MCESHYIDIPYDEIYGIMETPAETVSWLANMLNMPGDIMEHIIKYKDILECIGNRLYLVRSHVIEEDAPESMRLRYMHTVFYTEGDSILMLFTIGKGNEDPSQYTCAEFPNVRAASAALLELYEQHGIESPETLDKVYMNYIENGNQMCYSTPDYQQYDLGNLEDDMYKSLFCYDIWPMLGQEVYDFQNYGYVPAAVGSEYLSNQYMSASIEYNTVYSWYANNGFTPCNTIQYRYFARSGNSFKPLPKTGYVSFEFDTINAKYGNVLKKPFKNPYTNKMYVQVLPNDIYFVVPTIDAMTNGIMGSHYSFHNIQAFSPDYDPNTVYRDTIDVHKTVYDDHGSRIKHDPKCVFHNKSQVPIKSDGLKLDNLVCLNKKGAHKHFHSNFTDTTERDMLRDIVSLPYSGAVTAAKKAAASKIASAYQAFKQRGGGMALGLPENVQGVYVVLVRKGNEWHKTFNMLDGSGAIVDWFHRVGRSVAQRELARDIKEWLVTHEAIA